MTRLRRLLLGTLLGLATQAGCQQHHFMSEGDYRHYRNQAIAGTTPIPDCNDFSTLHVDKVNIRTVLNPEAPRRAITLAECTALALENGRTGEFFDRGGRRSTLAGPQRQSPVTNLTDSIRVFAFDPAIVAVDTEQSLAKFDTFWQTAMAWSRADRPIGTALDSFFGFGRTNIEQDTANFSSALLKPLPTGGLAGITFSTDYEFSNLNPRVNPAYRPSVSFNVEQPLLQGFGVALNEIRTTHPGSIRSNLFVPQGGRVPGILLTRIFADEARIEFTNRVNTLLFAVEQAYWELYAAYWDLYSREIALRQAQVSWQVGKARLDAGRISGTDLAQIEEQYQAFRAQRLAALGDGTGRLGVLEAERQLRYLIGLPPEDGTRLVPADAPTVAPYLPDYALAVATALANRPEIQQTRQEIQAAQLNLLANQNTLLPDIRAFANYDVVALGSQLDGPGDRNALANLADNRFQNWTLGVLGRVPLGFRDAHAEVRRAQLQLAQRVAFLQNQEQALAYSMVRSCRTIIQQHEAIKIQRARREAAATQLRLRYQEFQQGRGTIDVLLEAQRNWADALRDEHFAIADYNIALIELERQKGTIMEYNNVTVAEGPLPAAVELHASEHIRRRAGAIKLQDPQPRSNFEGYQDFWIPNLPEHKACDVPTVIAQTQALPAPPEKLLEANETSKLAPAPVSAPMTPTPAPTPSLPTWPTPPATSPTEIRRPGT